MVILRGIVIFWCLVSSVTSDTTGVQFVNPTPVLNIPVEIQSTDAWNPLKFNKDTTPEPLTTGLGDPPSGLVNPTPALQEFTTTGAANPMINNDGIISPQSTTPSDIQPTSVIHVPVVLETDSKYPLNIDNIPGTIATTGIIEDSLLKPTPVIKVPASPETTALLIPLTNDDTSEVPLTTEGFNFIEPSTVVLGNDGSETTAATPNIIDEKPNEVLSTQPIHPDATQSIPPCTCRYYEAVVPSHQGWYGHPHGNPPPHYFKPHGSKMNAWHPINIYQKYFNLHINFFVNNNPIPVLSANMYPYY
ncbi:uncharacterized protein [Epargyreus clarus]|uniref:uncharacterized protein n=1 Tax=Epargyreus clarus TaxID=520877 RepID=UPI003C2E11AF